MSVSALFGVKLAIPPPSAAVNRSIPRFSVGSGDGSSGLMIECSSRPRKKATKHHMKTRPRKSRPSDIRHRPAVYPPLPPLPPEWSLFSDESSGADDSAEPQPVLSE